MGLLDDYSQSMGDDGSQTADPVDIRKKRAELERQIVIVDADLKKLLREKQDLEIEKRRLKKQEERLRVEMGELDKKLKEMENSQRLFEEEINGLKKKQKVLQ